MTATARLADGLARRFGRRGFLARTAVAGSALVMEPRRFVLEPVSAYAAICSCSGQSCTCGSLCCDGYTEFCCTIYGENKCPPGTLMAGWWKVDGTPFCGGPRYYMDCNAACNGCGCGSNGICSGACSGTGCGCAQGNCDNRKAGCNQFRYGQCHQELACVGPIVCRVASCVAPWQIEPTCTGTERVDESTRWHDRECLHGASGSFDWIAETGGGVRVVGWALDKDVADQVLVQALVDGRLVVQTLANTYRPDVADFYRGWGAYHGFDFVIPGVHVQSTICVVALNAGFAGADLHLGCKQYSPTLPFGSVDQLVGAQPGVWIKGWAIDPNTSGPIQVRVRRNGTVVTEVTANLPRPDVNAAYPQYPGGHGFEVSLAVPAGRHEMCVDAVDVGAGSDVTLLCRTLTEPPACVSPPPPPPPQGSATGFVPLSPHRLADTRPDGPPPGGRKTPLLDADVMDLGVTGGSVPTDASAVVLNVTAVQPTKGSHMTVWPAGEGLPTASNLNYQAGVYATANLVISKVGCDGKVDLYNHQGSTDAVVDLMGYFPAGSGYTSLSPRRLLDTRPGTAPAGGPKAPLGRASSLNLTVTGGPVPTDASAVVVNVTAVTPTSDSHMTVWPAGEPQPTASNLNLRAGVYAQPNLVVAKVGAGGAISIYNHLGSTEVVVDLVGYFPSGTDYAALSPRRLLDTRPGTQPPGGSKVRLGPQSTTNLKVTGADVADSAGAVVVNVTAVAPSTTSYVTVWPAGDPRPTASHLNFNAGGYAFPNLVICKVGTAGEISIYNHLGSTDVVVDLMGWFPAP